MTPQEFYEFIIKEDQKKLHSFEEKFKKFMEEHSNYDVCLLLGDHNFNDITVILKYINKDKIYGLLGNYDHSYLDEFNIRNLNGTKEISTYMYEYIELKDGEI